MYLGRRMHSLHESDRIHNSGGASYLLNQASVGLLAGHLNDGACRPHTEKPWEDVLVKHSIVIALLGKPRINRDIRISTATRG